MLKKYRKIFPQQIDDELVLLIIRQNQLLSMKEVNKLGRLLRKRLKLKAKYELMRLLIYFVYENGFIEKAQREGLKDIASTIGIDPETFEKILKSFVPGATVIDRELFYEMLGIDSNASSDEIRKAYLQMCKKYHPDLYMNKSTDEFKEAHNKFIEISNAYQMIKQYDQNERF